MLIVETFKQQGSAKFKNYGLLIKDSILNTWVYLLLLETTGANREGEERQQIKENNTSWKLENKS